MTEIKYVPGGPEMNRYDPGRDEILLDEGLKDYPLAHEHILRHELLHVRNKGKSYSLMRDAMLEFSEDAFRYFAMNSTAREARRYVAENSGIANRSFLEFTGTVLINGMRSVWEVPMIVLGALYRRLKG